MISQPQVFAPADISPAKHRQTARDPQSRRRSGNAQLTDYAPGQARKDLRDVEARNNLAILITSRVTMRSR